ncbi:MAG TPA: hypothetical protein PLN79_15965 [bacterium]|nr:hypothetical protein [bacterium]
MTSDEVRKKFVEKYLVLFNVNKIEFKLLTNQKICGTAIFDDTETQDFCWNVDNSYVPSLAVIEILEILKKERMIDGDRIVCSDDMIYSKCQIDSYDIFKIAMNEIRKTEIKMIDGAVETDSFFLHN